MSVEHVHDRSYPRESGPSERGIDFDRLRADRLAQVQKEMAAHELGALLLTDALHIRYCTGIDLMSLWSATNLWHYIVVPSAGDPIVFAHEKERSRAAELWSDVRPAHSWQARFAAGNPEGIAARWAGQVRDVLTGCGLEGEQVGIDRLDHFGFRALNEAGVLLADADTVMQAARLVKTVDELDLVRCACAVGEAAVYRLEKEIRPGLTEHQLYSLFFQTAIEMGGEHTSARLLSSGYRTNPWYQEASSKPLRPGDLVAFDTDLSATHGYVCDFSRTFVCASMPTRAQREAYRAAHDFLRETITLLQPGTSYLDIARRAPAYPERYMPQRYPIILHGVGLEDEPPFLPFPDDVDTHSMPAGQLRPGMVVSVEAYMGEPGAQDGVKLEDMVWISAEGPKVLSQYPFDEALLS